MHNDIVHGLKFCVVIRKMGVTVVKDEEVVGSFSPTAESHTIQLSPEKVPEGFFKRGQYTGKAMLVDLDLTCHVQYDFNF